MSLPDENQSQASKAFQDVKWGAEKLAAVRIFKKFSQEEREKIYGIGKIVSLKSKAHAVIEGENTRGLFMILAGTLSVYKNDNESGAMFRIAYMEEGQTFGELSLFDHAPRSATVLADTQCYLFYLGAEVFEEFLRTEGFEFSSRFYQTCAEDLADRFRAINSDYINAQQMLWKYALRRSESGVTPSKATSPTVPNAAKNKAG